MDGFPGPKDVDLLGQDYPSGSDRCLASRSIHLQKRPGAVCPRPLVVCQAVTAAVRQRRRTYPGAVCPLKAHGLCRLPFPDRLAAHGAGLTRAGNRGLIAAVGHGAASPLQYRPSKSPSALHFIFHPEPGAALPPRHISLFLAHTDSGNGPAPSHRGYCPGCQSPPSAADAPPSIPGWPRPPGPHSTPAGRT